MATIDVCCGASTFDSELRCQLFVGHETPHASAVFDHGERIIRVWEEASSSARYEAAEHEHGYPWAPGMPVATGLRPALVRRGGNNAQPADIAARRARQSLRPKKNPVILELPAVGQ